MFGMKEGLEEEDEEIDELDKEEAVKVVKDTNKLEERDAAMRGTQQNMSSSDLTTLRVSSHTVDVKNNVEKGLTTLLSFNLLLLIIITVGLQCIYSVYVGHVV